MSSTTRQADRTGVNIRPGSKTAQLFLQTPPSAGSNIVALSQDPAAVPPNGFQRYESLLVSTRNIRERTNTGPFVVLLVTLT